jgi:hypothetical protein
MVLFGGRRTSTRADRYISSPSNNLGAPQHAVVAFAADPMPHDNDDGHGDGHGGNAIVNETPEKSLDTSQILGSTKPLVRLLLYE